MSVLRKGIAFAKIGAVFLVAALIVAVLIIAILRTRNVGYFAFAVAVLIAASLVAPFPERSREKWDLSEFDRFLMISAGALCLIGGILVWVG